MLKTIFTVLIFTQSALAVNTMVINGQTYTCGDGQEFRSVNGQIVCLLPTPTAAAPQATPAPVAAPVATTTPLEPVAPAVAPAVPATPDTFTNNPASASLITEVYGPTLQCADGSLAQFVNGSYRCNVTPETSTSFRERLRGMHAARNSRFRGSRNNSMTIVTHANGSRTYFSCPASYIASYENSVFTCKPGEDTAAIATTTGDLSGTSTVAATPAAATVVDEVVTPILEDTSGTTVVDGSNTVVLNGQTYICNGNVSITDTQALCNGIAMTPTPATVSQ